MDENQNPASVPTSVPTSVPMPEEKKEGEISTDSAPVEGAI